MGRKPCCAKEGLNRGAWTAIEDKTLVDYINSHGEGNWRNLPKRAGLKRCGKSCRLRWLNYLRPGIKRGNITNDEEELIIRLHKLLGNRWSLIAGRLPGRTDNEIKNYWNTNIGKKLVHQDYGMLRTDCPNSTTMNNTNTSKPSPGLKTAINSGKPNVIRTKASRCSKVIIFPHDLQKPHDNPNAVSKSVKQDSSTGCNKSNSEENLQAGLLDYQMDEKLLSDLLMVGDNDHELRGFDNGAGIEAVNALGRGQLSPGSEIDDQSLTFPENLQHLDDLDIESMASFIEFEFDWLREF